MNYPQNNSVSAVYGSWIVPTLTPIGKDTYSAIWIGIDGYASSTVEQIGTSHDMVNGVQQNYAWFEMYPGPAYIIMRFPVNSGDFISGSVEYSGNQTFTMIIYNHSKKVVTTIPTSYTQSSTALRNSAEWIVEAPWYNQVLPLSNFGTIHLMSCTATINGIRASIKNDSWQHVSIEMINPNGTPKAIPSDLLPDNASFFVTWKHE